MQILIGYARQCGEIHLCSSCNSMISILVLFIKYTIHDIPLRDYSSEGSFLGS